MGLGFLGRGQRVRAVRVGIIHMIGGALGGASVAAILAIAGGLLGADRYQFWIIGGVSLIALWHATSKRKAQLGTRRQVPRGWGRSMRPELSFFLWGVMLGTGVLTVIPYSAALVILSAQFTSSVVAAAASGAVLGAARESTVFMPLVRANQWSDLSTLMGVLSDWKANMERINIVWVVGAGTALIVASLL